MVDFTKPIQLCDYNGHLIDAFYHGVSKTKDCETLYIVEILKSNGTSFLLKCNEDGKIRTSITDGIIQNVPPVKKTGWVNLYISEVTGEFLFSKVLHVSKEAAAMYAASPAMKQVKVEWEE